MWQMKLTPAEMKLGELHGRERFSRAKAGSDIYMKPNQSEELRESFHIQGARGEIAVARYLDLPWSGGEPDGRNRRDVGDLVEVRTKKIRGGLIVKHLEQKKNPPSTPYVLAWFRGTSTVQLLGWMKLGDILDRGEQYEQRGIWFARIPYQNLIPIQELRCLIHS